MKSQLKIIIPLAALLIITIIVTLVVQSIQSTKNITTVPLINTGPSTTPVPGPTLPVLDKTVALKNKKLILPKFPIIIKDFNTSVGINTYINIDSYPTDSEEIVHLEIYGPDYQYNQDDPQTNPNMIAFKESFDKAKQILSDNKVDIRKLQLSMNTKAYIRDIANDWIIKLNLLK